MNFITKQVEKKLGVDLNGDGVIGSGYGRHGYGGGYARGHGAAGGGGMMNQLERATGMDLNGDGRIGGGYGHPPQQYYPPQQQYYPPPPPQQYYAPPPQQYYAPPPQQYYPPPQQYPSHHGGGGGGGLMNTLEKVTHMDLNGDGRIGGGYGAPHNPYGRHY